MSRPLELELRQIETVCAAIETAIDAEDWTAAGQGNADLDARLAVLAGLISDDQRPPADPTLALIATRLERVLATHARLAGSLFGRREEAAAGLAKLRTGRRGATHYLETAEY